MKNPLIKMASIVILMVVLLLVSPLNTFASYSDIKSDATYLNSVNRLVSLGILNGSDKQFRPNDLLTREQFSKMIVVAAGLDNLAQSMKGPTDFPDVAANSWSSGYINAAISKNYITGGVDGKFHPTQAITFSQICTILVRALGYTTADLTGTWPYNYVAKAYDLGLTDGINLKNDAGVPRWAAAVMIDRLLDTEMKQANPAAAAQTFMEASGYYVKCLVFGDSSTIDTLSPGQILTDKGTFNNPSKVKVALGSESYLAVKNGNVVSAAQTSDTLNVSVDQVTDNRVSYKDGDNEESILLPDNTTYYYQGKKTDLNTVLGLLQKSFSLVFNYNSDKTSFDSAVVLDPVYSKPEIAENFVPSTGRLGSIVFGSNPTIMKDGDVISISQIENDDVLYQVSDIWGGNKYFLDVAKKVGGKITDVQPNRVSPKTLQIDGVNYDFSKDIDVGKITSSYGDFVVDNNIIVSLGHDGKIVNVKTIGAEDNYDYAVVLDTGYTISSGADGLKTTTYTAKLLLSNGMTMTTNVASNAVEMKGGLVQYRYIDNQTMVLTKLAYNLPGAVNIQKDDRLMNTSYVADNVKIFDTVTYDSGEVQAKVLDWKDMPEGSIPVGKVMFTNTVGDFNDINIIVTNDIFNQRYKTGIIKSSTPTAGKGKTYKALIDGKEYTYTDDTTAGITGNVYEFNMTSTGVDGIAQPRQVPNVTGKAVQALDSRRIKINDTVYFLSDNITVYFKDALDSSVTLKTLADIETNNNYQKVDLYMDNYNGNNGKVVAIVITD